MLCGGVWRALAGAVGLECGGLPCEGSRGMDWLERGATAAAIGLDRQQQPVSDSGGCALSELGQSGDAAVSGAVESGLGGALGARAAGGGKFRGWAVVSGHQLCGQRLDATGVNGRLGAAPARFLRAARSAQAVVGARTAGRCPGGIVRRVPADALGGMGGLRGAAVRLCMG